MPKPPLVPYIGRLKTLLHEAIEATHYVLNACEPEAACFDRSQPIQWSALADASSASWSTKG